MKRIVMIFFLFIFFLIFSCSCGNGNYNNIDTTSQSQDKPQFRKDGELTFFTSTKTITIDVEIPENFLENMLGLMYRVTMNETQGMLFIYNIIKERSFWMKNTYISLDMFFVNEKMEIIEIVRNTVPLSEDLIPTPKETKYVIEVTARFSDKYGINIGDYISITLL